MRGWMWLALVLVALIFLVEAVSTTVNSVVKKIARAIARAEGFFVPGSKASRNNNPGNLKGTDGMFVVYPTAEEGWLALERQVSLMFSGSKIYRPDMTLLEVALRYTATQQQEWAKNVAFELGVPVTTKLNEIA